MVASWDPGGRPGSRSFEEDYRVFIPSRLDRQDIHAFGSSTAFLRLCLDALRSLRFLSERYRPCEAKHLHVRCGRDHDLLHEWNRDDTNTSTLLLLAGLCRFRTLGFAECAWRTAKLPAETCSPQLRCNILHCSLAIDNAVCDQKLRCLANSSQHIPACLRTHSCSPAAVLVAPARSKQS